MAIQSSPNSYEFSGWRRYLWPVHGYELKKLFPMLLIFFLVSFDYNILRTMKDTVVLYAESSGAEVIPFIKVWVMFPGAVLMTYIFTKLSNRFSRESVFYIMVSSFLIFYAAYTFILHPYRDLLHPNETADHLATILPPGCKGLIAMFRNWTSTLFYVMAELWSAIILSVLFWGFANQVTRLFEAKRFYGLFGIGANLSGVAAGAASVYISQLDYNPLFPFGYNKWEQSSYLLTMLIVVSGILTMFLFRWFNKNVLTDPRFYDVQEAHQEEKVKGKLSMGEAISYLMRSRYLVCLAVIVISYNLVINLVEVVWKNEVKALYPDPNDYSIYMNRVVLVIGFIATFTALFVSGNSIRKCGWTFTAMLTPLILLITSAGFFTFLFIQDYLSPGMIGMMGGMTPLAIVVFFGSANNILSRASKYSVFDATKEMAFVPLGADSKIKGKAVIDGVCSRFGKSGGSFIHQSLLLTFSTISASAPYVAGFLLIIIAVWMGAIRLLGIKFNEIAGTTSQPITVDTEKTPVFIHSSEKLKEQQAAS